MLLIAYLKALIIGVFVSGPLGPIAILCIQKTLSKGRISGFCIGIGAAISDLISSVLAIFSLSFVYAFFEKNEAWVLLVGGLIILFVGLTTMLKNPFNQMRQPKNPTPAHHIQEVLQGFAMTISNPGSFVLLLGLFALVGLDPSDFNSPLPIAVLFAGVATGTIGWWFFLSWLVSIFRGRFQMRSLLWFNRISGAVIAGFGVFALIEGILKFIPPVAA